MTPYAKAVALWQQKNITTDAELAEAINGHSIAYAYHSGKIENDLITYNGQAMINAPPKKLE